MTHFRKVSKSNKLFKSANLQIYDLQKLICGPPIFADLVRGAIPKVSDNGKFTYTVVCGVQVELTPPSPGELGAVVRGAGGLVKDALTFRWAQVQIFLYNLG